MPARMRRPQRRHMAHSWLIWMAGDGFLGTLLGLFGRVALEQGLLAGMGCNLVADIDSDCPYRCFCAISCRSGWWAWSCRLIFLRSCLPQTVVWWPLPVISWPISSAPFTTGGETASGLPNCLPLIIGILAIIVALQMQQALGNRALFLCSWFLGIFVPYWCYWSIKTFCIGSDIIDDQRRGRYVNADPVWDKSSLWFWMPSFWHFNLLLVFRITAYFDSRGENHNVKFCIGHLYLQKQFLKMITKPWIEKQFQFWNKFPFDPFHSIPFHSPFHSICLGWVGIWGFCSVPFHSFLIHFIPSDPSIPWPNHSILSIHSVSIWILRLIRLRVTVRFLYYKIIPDWGHHL